MNKIVFYGSGNISQAILSGLISSGYGKNLIEFVDRNKINSVFHYTPLHNSKMSKKFGQGSPECPTTIEISERIIRLPMF